MGASIGLIGPLCQCQGVATVGFERHNNMAESEILEGYFGEYKKITDIYCVSTMCQA